MGKHVYCAVKRVSKPGFRWDRWTKRADRLTGGLSRFGKVGPYVGAVMPLWEATQLIRCDAKCFWKHIKPPPY